MNHFDTAVAFMQCVRSHIQTPESYILARKFGNPNQSWETAHSYYKVHQPGNEATRYVPKTVGYVIAGMYYKYANKHQTITNPIKMEDAIWRIYNGATESTQRRIDRMLATDVSSPTFPKMFHGICTMVQKQVPMSSIDYTALLCDLMSWKSRETQSKWSRAILRWDPTTQSNSNVTEETNNV